MTESRPLVVLLAGPNGAGKTTTAPELLRGALAVDEFVNADGIAGGLSVFRPETAARAAGRAMLARLRELEEAGRSFAFETTLASRSFAPRLARLRRAVYRTPLMFLSLPNADLAVARVAGRVQAGGHHVEETTIRRRFLGGLRNLRSLYEPVLDCWQVFDNSTSSSPRLIASCRTPAAHLIHDVAAWAILFPRDQP